MIGLLADKPVKAVTTTTKCAPAFVAIYTDDSGHDAFACLVDYALTAALGASLALIPAAVAAEEAKAKAISELLLSNAYEVLNVLAAAFNDTAPAEEHVRLRALRPIADSPKLPTSSSARTDLDVTVTSYATGKLAIVVLPN